MAAKAVSGRFRRPGAKRRANALPNERRQTILAAPTVGGAASRGGASSPALKMCFDMLNVPKSIFLDYEPKTIRWVLWVLSKKNFLLVVVSSELQQLF